MSTDMDIQAMMTDLGKKARGAVATLSTASTEAKNTALREAAQALRASVPALLDANEKDMSAGREKGLTDAMLDRLKLDEGRIEAIALGLEAIAELPDPVGAVMAEWNRPNGLQISRVRTPLGVIGIIYESRPNVTADAGALCLKAGNAAILRGGSESFNSSTAIFDCLQAGLAAAGLPKESIQMIPTRDRAAVGVLLTMTEYVDVIVPRGGKGLVERVQTEARVPVFAHLEGICHTYVDKAADLNMAVEVVLNAKMRRTGICGATETLLVDKAADAAVLPALVDALQTAGCEVRGDDAVQAINGDVQAATPEDWATEYLNPIISVRLVDGVDGAIAHIGEYSSHHTDCIITSDQATADKFIAEVDSAIVVHNASTQYADGGEFGMGAEIGISTGRMHARGPVGTEQLTTFKYVVRGNGQCRP